MTGSLCCKACGARHKATSRNFPIVLYNKQEVFQGAGLKRKSLGKKKVVVGYICRKCTRTYSKQDFIQRHNIKPKKGQRLQEAMAAKAKELKMARSSIIKPGLTKKQTGWDKVKGWTKDRFFKKRGRG